MPGAAAAVAVAPWKGKELAKLSAQQQHNVVGGTMSHLLLDYKRQLRADRQEKAQPPSARQLTVAQSTAAVTDFCLLS